MTDGEFDNLTVNNVLTIGEDTNLYRSAADVLATDDTFWVKKDHYVGDNWYNLYMSRNMPRILFGDRSGTWDTNLYRSATNVLATNDDFRLEVGSADHRGLALQRSGIDSRIFFTEAYKQYGFSIIYASDDNPAFDGTSFTLPQNYLYFIRHDNSETGQVVMQIPRTLSQVWLPAQGSSGGLLIGGDANLYRSAANTLKTDDQLVVGSTLYHNTEQILGSNGSYFKILSTASTAPTQHMHFMADYVKQNGSTDVTLFFGYNSEIKHFRWYNK